MPSDPSPTQYDWLRSVYTRRSLKPDWAALSGTERANALQEAARGDDIARARPTPDAMRDWSWPQILGQFEKS